MTEAEFIEGFTALVSASISSIALYFSAITGYLIVAYMVGAKLSRSQLYIISGLFVTFSVIMAFTGFSLMERAVLLEVGFEGERDALDWTTYFLLVAQLLGVLTALKFMADIRKSV